MSEQLPKELEELINKTDQKIINMERKLSYKYGVEDCYQAMQKTHVPKEMVERLSSALLGFIEYFHAIERGEYVNNGREARIRDFEQVLIDKSLDALKELEGENEN